MGKSNHTTIQWNIGDHDKWNTAYFNLEQKGTYRRGNKHGIS